MTVRALINNKNKALIPPSTNILIGTANSLFTVELANSSILALTFSSDLALGVSYYLLLEPLCILSLLAVILTM